MHSKRVHGVVKWWNGTSGCGFIAPNDGGPDCFFLQSPAWIGKTLTVEVGARVEFTRVVEAHLYCAIDVVLVPAGPHVDANDRLMLGEMKVDRDAYLFVDALPKPIRLFKYLSPEWADAMVLRGSVLVNTMWAFHKFEDDEERQDTGESTHQFLVEGKSGLEFDHNTDVPVRYRGLISAPKGTIQLNAGARLRYVLHEPNVWVYCATEQFDHDLMQRFGGACVEIDDHSRFFRDLCATLHNTAGRRERRLFAASIFGRCIYRERHEHQLAPGDLEVHFIKPPAYRHQKEVRCVWQPMPRQNVAPVSLTIPSLSEYCKRTH